MPSKQLQPTNAWTLQPDIMSWFFRSCKVRGGATADQTSLNTLRLVYELFFLWPLFVSHHCQTFYRCFHPVVWQKWFGPHLRAVPYWEKPNSHRSYGAVPTQSRKMGVDYIGRLSAHGCPTQQKFIQLKLLIDFNRPLPDDVLQFLLSDSYSLTRRRPAACVVTGRFTVIILEY